MSLAEPFSPAVTAPPAAPAIGTTDGELLLRFSKHGCQQSFAQLVDAHGPLVWATCRQVLCHHDDVEDAFQATFLILARRANDIRASDSAAPWLYRVAYRTSLALSRQRRANPTEPLGDREVLDDRPDPLEHLHQQHMVAVLVEELRALPDRYQAPLVLCYLEGRSRQGVAELLDCTVATVKGRLARGRQLLRQRLARRGVALSLASGAAATAVVQAQSALAGSPLPAATASAALSPTAPLGDLGISTTVSQLVNQGVSAMTYASLFKPCAVIAATLLLGVATAVALDEPDPQVTTGGSAAAVGSDLTIQLDAATTTNDSVTSAEDESTPSVHIEANSPPATQPAAAPPTTFDSVIQRPSFQNIPIEASNIPIEASAPAGTQPATPPSPSTRQEPLGTPASGYYRPQAAPPTPVYTQQVVPQPRYNGPYAPSYPQPTPNIPTEGEPSLQQLQLMLEHWQAKSEGLRLKASVLVNQSQNENDQMKRAEGMLALADAYEADAERLAVEGAITRRQQSTPLAVAPHYVELQQEVEQLRRELDAARGHSNAGDRYFASPPYTPQPAMPYSPSQRPAPATAVPGPVSIHPGQHLQVLIIEGEEGQQRQMVLMSQVDGDGRISLPGMFEGSIKVKDLQKVEGEIKEKIIKRIETTSPRKIGEGDIRVRVLASPVAPVLFAPTTDAYALPRTTPSQLPTSNFQPPTPTPPTLSAPPLPANGPAPFNRDPESAPRQFRDAPPAATQNGFPPGPSSLAPGPSPRSEAAEEIRQLRQRIKQLEKTLQQQSAPVPKDPPTDNPSTPLGNY